MESTLRQTAPAGRNAALRLQIGLSFFAFILIGCIDAAFGVILPSLSDHYNVDKATISLIFLGGTLGYLSSALSSGPLVERLGLRLFLVTGTGMLIVGETTFALQPPFLVLLGAQFFAGFGIGLIDAGLNSYIASLPSNTAVLNYLHAFYGIGALLGPVIASAVLAIGLGWNSVYVVWLALGLLTLVGAALLFQPGRREREENEGNVLAAALRQGIVWLAAAFLLVYVGAEVSLGTWSYSFLTEERHSPELLSAWAVSAYWAGLTVGRLVLGRVAARLGDRQTIQLCLIGVAVGVLLVWIAPFGLVAAVGLVLTGFSLGPIFPTTIALISKLVPSRLLPGAIGFMAALGSMGAAFFPWLAGNLAQAYGLWTLLPGVIVLTIAMVVIWLFLSARHAGAAIVDQELAA